MINKLRLLIKPMIWMIICVITAQLYGLGTKSFLPPIAETMSLAVAGRTIVIDPGHGGEDPGARSSYSDDEKDIVLLIALELQELLVQSGATVILTRDGDYDLVDENRKPGKTRKRSDLENRKKIVEDSGADLLISVHANSISSSRWSGPQTFYSDHLPENRMLAVMIQQSLNDHVVKTHRLARPIDAFIVRTAQCPSILVEVGFLSNPKEGKLLSQPAYQRKVAYGLYSGITRYFSGQFRF